MTQAAEPYDFDAPSATQPFGSDVLSHALSQLTGARSARDYESELGTLRERVDELEEGAASAAAELEQVRMSEAQAVARVRELEHDLHQARLGARLHEGVATASLRNERRKSHLLHQNKHESSIMLLEKAHERQKVALEKAHDVERQLFAAKLIQLHGRTQLEKAQTERAALEQRLEEQREYHLRQDAFAEKTLAAADALTRQEAMRAERSKADDKGLKIHSRDGSSQPLDHWLKTLVVNQLHHDVMATCRSDSPAQSSSKFKPIDINVLRVGKPENAALGLQSCLLLHSSELHARLGKGVEGIRMEVEACGDEEVQECFEYVTTARAGSSPKLYGNSPYPRDCDGPFRNAFGVLLGPREDRKDANGQGMLLADFVEHETAKRAELSEAHVVALRLYSTAAFHLINSPLRDQERSTPHPLAATVTLLADGIKKLRAIDTEKRHFALWRGMKNLDVLDDFAQKGGTEHAPMSTTSDVTVAVQYAMSTHSLLFKVVANSFMERGADIAFLSAFPGEKEYVYPPLTYLEPTGGTATIEVEEGAAGAGSPPVKITVVEVQPKIP